MDLNIWQRFDYNEIMDLKYLIGKDLVLELLDKWELMSRVGNGTYIKFTRIDSTFIQVYIYNGSSIYMFYKNVITEIVYSFHVGHIELLEVLKGVKNLHG